MGDVVDFEIGRPHGFNGDGYSTPEQIIQHLPDPVNSPPHYKQNGVETIDIIEHIAPAYPSIMTYHIGNALKYLCRAPHKGKLLEDLQKARWYLDRAIGGNLG